MLKIFLWLRYLRKKKIVFLSVAAVAVSVSLLIVVSSLFTGFISTFEQAAVQAIGDVVVTPPNIFEKYPRFIEMLEQAETVETATAVLTAPGLLQLGKGNVRPVEIWGIQPERRTKVIQFKSSLLRQQDLPDVPSFTPPGDSNETGGFVGIGLLGEPDELTDEYDFDAIKNSIGQLVFVTTGTTPESEESTTRFRRKIIPFRIADVVFTGVYPLDNELLYLPIEELQKVLYPNEELPVARQIQIKLRDDVEPDTALAVVRGVWESFVQENLGGDQFLIKYTSIVTAKELQKRYVAAYKKQMGVLLLIFGVVSLGVILLVFCIFYMIVRMKQKDIAIIKSCGAASSSVAAVFIGFGACVGIAGSSLGLVFGYIITNNVNIIEGWISVLFGLKLWKSSVYMFSKIPNQVDWPMAWYIVGLAVIAAAVGTLIPAIVAAGTKPVEILRYE